MGTSTSRRAQRLLSVMGALLAMSIAGSQAATTEYQYDALGRLRKVVHENGVVTDYTLDAMGNRTQVVDQAPTPPSVPSPFNVPSSNTTGTINLSWGAATGAVTRYELYVTSHVFARCAVAVIT